MNNKDIRVFIEYNGEVSPAIIQKDLGLAALIHTCLLELVLDGEVSDYECFLLINSFKKCNIKSSSFLRENDVLQLTRKNSSFLNSKNEELQEEIQFSKVQDEQLSNLKVIQKEGNDKDFKSKINLSIQLDDVSYETTGESGEGDSIKFLDGDKSFDTYDKFDGEEDQEDEECPCDDEKEGEDKIKIELKELSQKTFKNREELKKSLDLWAAEKKMSLSFRTQERINLDESKASKLLCSKKENLVVLSFWNIN